MTLKVEGKSLEAFFGMQTKIRGATFKKLKREEGSALLGNLIIEYYKNPDEIKKAVYQVKGIRPFPPALFLGASPPDLEDYEWITAFAKRLWDSFGKQALLNTVGDWESHGLDVTASIYTFPPSYIEKSLKE